MMFRDCFTIVGLLQILIVFPLVQTSVMDTMTQLLDINKLSTLSEDVDKIVETLAHLKAKCEAIEVEYKKLFFGLDKIKDVVTGDLSYRCNKGVYYSKTCLDYHSEETTFNEAQQKCLSEGGTLFRPNITNPNVTKDIKDIFVDLHFTQAIVDVHLECSPDNVYKYSNGLIIPRALLSNYEACIGHVTPQYKCNKAASYALNFDGPNLFKCFNVLHTKLPYFCQCDPVINVSPVGELNLIPSELDLEMIHLHTLHRNLKQEIDKVEKQLQEAAINFKAKKETVDLQE